MLRILTVQKLWDFNFLRGLAPGLLDKYLIGRYEKKRESFDLFAAKFESGAMRFSGGKSPKHCQNMDSTFVFLILGTVNGKDKGALEPKAQTARAYPGIIN